MTSLRAWLVGRKGRFLIQIVLLPVLYLLSLPDPLFFTNIIFVIAVLALPINFTVAGILEWSHHQAPEIESLRERANDAWTLVMMNLATVGASVVTVLLRLGIEIPGRPALALLSWLCILIVVPALAALRPWREVWLPAVRRRLNGDGQDA